MLAATFKIIGPARPFYIAPETDEYRGRTVLTTSREALASHPSPSSGPVHCTLTDTAETVWVRPIHLANPDA